VSSLPTGWLPIGEDDAALSTSNLDSVGHRTLVEHTLRLHDTPGARGSLQMLGSTARATCKLPVSLAGRPGCPGQFRPDGHADQRDWRERRSRRWPVPRRRRSVSDCSRKIRRAFGSWGDRRRSRRIGPRVRDEGRAKMPQPHDGDSLHADELSGGRLS
jgi:hypothetical protein